jgi:hypothetical protein
MEPSYDKHLIQKSAGKAGSVLGLTDWFDDLKFLLVCSQLSNLMGHDEKLMNHWMQTPNKHLDGKVPANLIVTAEGTEKLLSLLEWYSQ